MGRVVYEEKIWCSGCRAALLVEYAADADTHAADVGVQCPACHVSFSVALARPASVFLVRIDGDEPVMQARLA